MIIIKKLKFVWFEYVYGWVMTGVIGQDGKWFFGYSKKPDNNQDLIDLLQKAINKNVK